jgi:hypothetical protein
VLLASRGERPSDAQLARRAAALDRRGDFDPGIEELARRRLPDADVRGVPVLSDGFAPVDRLIHLGDELPTAGD